MQLEEAHSIARFLNAPVAEVIKHSGATADLGGAATRILLAATIDEAGIVSRLKESNPLPQSFIDRALAAISITVGGKIIAAQIRATSGPLAMWDDAIVLFSHTEIFEGKAIGSLAICRTMDGEQRFVRIERARKTGEATIRHPNDKVEDARLQTASPVIAIIP